jgi:hypothetical protein
MLAILLPRLRLLLLPLRSPALLPPPAAAAAAAAAALPLEVRCIAAVVAADVIALLLLSLLKLELS